jgi:hypothetical protein
MFRELLRLRLSAKFAGAGHFDLELRSNCDDGTDSGAQPVQPRRG